MRSFLVSLVIIFCSFACSEDRLAEESTLNTANSPQAITILSEESKDDNIYSERAELIFSEDKVTLTREVVAGDILIVRYDLSRMKDCKAEGRAYLPVLTGYYQVDEQDKQSFDYPPSYSTANRMQSSSIEVPNGEQLSFSFQMVDNRACESWDSNFEAGYRIKIKASDDSVIEEQSLLTFKADGEVIQSAPLKSGALVSIKYDLDRLSDCISYQNDLPQWGVMGHFKSNLTDEESFQVSQTINGELEAPEIILEIPEGDELILWFTASNRYGCFQEDLGASFEIE